MLVRIMISAKPHSFCSWPRHGNSRDRPRWRSLPASMARSELWRREMRVEGGTGRMRSRNACECCVDRCWGGIANRYVVGSISLHRCRSSGSIWLLLRELCIPGTRVCKQGSRRCVCEFCACCTRLGLGIALSPCIWSMGCLVRCFFHIGFGISR